MGDFRGRPFRMLVVLDEYTRECLAIEVARNFRGEEIVAVLDELTAIRGHRCRTSSWRASTAGCVTSCCRRRSSARVDSGVSGFSGWAFTPVRFNNGLFGQPIAAGDWRASQTGQGTGEFVIRLQAQVLL